MSVMHGSYKTREEAVMAACHWYLKPYSDLRSKRMRGTCPIHRAGGHIYFQQMGGKRHWWFYIGA